MFDPEVLLPSAIHWALPQLSEKDEGDDLVREALGNPALDYQERSDLLRRGQQIQAQNKDRRDLRALGEGIAAGGIGAVILNKILQGAGTLGDDLRSFRRDYKINALNSAIQRAEALSPGFQKSISKEIAKVTGLNARDFPNIQAALKGPLAAWTGSADQALDQAGKIFLRQTRSAGLPYVGKGVDPTIFKGLRLTGSYSTPLLTDVLLDGVRSVTGKAKGLSSSTLARTLMTGAGVGLGGLVSYLASKEEPGVVVMTPEEAEAYLRKKDTEKARRRPLAETPEALKSTFTRLNKAKDQLTNKYEREGTAQSLIDGFGSVEDASILPALRDDDLDFPLG